MVQQLYSYLVALILAWGDSAMGLGNVLATSANTLTRFGLLYLSSASDCLGLNSEDSLSLPGNSMSGREEVV